MDRQGKEQGVSNLQRRFGKATAAVVAEYKGLTVAQLNQLRRELREVGGEYHVAKNTLVEIAIEGSPYLSLKDILTGQNGLAFGYGDAIGLAKVVTRYAKEHDKFVIKGGMSDGQFLSASRVEAVAQLPSREVLRAQLLGVLSRPATQLASLMAESGARLARLLDSRKSQLEQS
ncbi:MAG: 50S ribosomal protein L10 [Deltaproteobacteria bacterium]|nr:50S ribosomal protein L10 [Deltaproteobacteria bacterium]